MFSLTCGRTNINRWSYQIAGKTSDISVVVDFSLWKKKKLYTPDVLIPFDILNWKDLSRSIELGLLENQNDSVRNRDIMR